MSCFRPFFRSVAACSRLRLALDRFSSAMSSSTWVTTDCRRAWCAWAASRARRLFSRSVVAAISLAQVSSAGVTGTAKLRVWPARKTPTATPMTLPSWVRMGPPLLPGEMGAVIW